MPSGVDEAVPTIAEHVAHFEKEYHLADGFLRSLLREDDWSFIIKIHALLEAAISKLLAEVLDPRLLEIFQRLELGNRQIGKLRFADALDALEKRDRKFISTLSELRNDLVHDISQIGFSFREYLEKLGQIQRGQFLDTLTAFADEETKEEWLLNAEKSPKETIWLFTVRILLASSLKIMKAGLDRTMISLSLKELDLIKGEKDADGTVG